MAVVETADSASARKLRGAFFTSPKVCDYVIRWAVRSAQDRVLEPSCGEAAFLLAAAQRLRNFGVRTPEVDGVEVHRPSTDTAERLLRHVGARPRIRSVDFLTLSAEPRFDVVVGNPPYVRYQDFRGTERETALSAAAAAGVRLTNLASSWAAFTVHAARFVMPGGRLGLVLPAELLTVNYAAEVRRYLLSRFGRVRLMMFTERIFPGVLEEVVLLLAEGEGGTDRCEVAQVSDVGSLDDEGIPVTQWVPADPAAKWTPALLPPTALSTYQQVTGHPAMGTLRAEWGETTLGMVTGNNAFFTVAPKHAVDLGLSRGDTVRISPPGSRHLRSLTLPEVEWTQLGATGSSTLLFRPQGTPSPAAAKYIARGEQSKVHEAYKCRVRSPWWRVPLVEPADLLLTCMNADAPQLATNEAALHHLNSVHGVYLAPQHRDIGRELLPMAALNSLTLLGAELLGRTYGGGILKIEPKEADRLPMPSAALLRSLRQPLRDAFPDVKAALAGGLLAEAIDRVDEIILLRGLRLTLPQRRTLVHARQSLAARRAARGRSVGAR